jgi:hypothetical protein
MLIYVLTASLFLAIFGPRTIRTIAAIRAKKG